MILFRLKRGLGDYGHGYLKFNPSHIKKALKHLEREFYMEFTGVYMNSLYFHFLSVLEPF